MLNEEWVLFWNIFAGVKKSGKGYWKHMMICIVFSNIAKESLKNPYASTHEKLGLVRLSLLGMLRQRCMRKPSLCCWQGGSHFVPNHHMGVGERSWEGVSAFTMERFHNIKEREASPATSQFPFQESSTMTVVKGEATAVFLCWHWVLSVLQVVRSSQSKQDQSVWISSGLIWALFLDCAEPDICSCDCNRQNNNFSYYHRILLLFGHFVYITVGTTVPSKLGVSSVVVDGAIRYKSVIWCNQTN